MKPNSNTTYIVSISGGKDSTALLLWSLEHLPGESIVPVFANTGNEHELVFEYLAYLEKELGVRIRQIKPPLDFFRLAKKKKRFPSPTRRFCTQELKILPTRAFLQGIEGEKVLMLGIRRDESSARAHALEWEWSDAYGCDIWRPLVAWTVEQVFEIHRRHGIEPNPLYKLGYRRVGCMPCIFASKNEVNLIARLHPEHIEKIRHWEAEVDRTFFGPLKPGQINFINEVVAWATGGTVDGGEVKMQGEFAFVNEGRCSVYNLCE